jgi:cobalt-zinc-cadmium efflux system membrane fusion protein
MVAAIIAILLTVSACGRTVDTETHGHAEGEDHHGEGPHGGRLLRADRKVLELLIAEADGPPAFKAYLLDDQQKVVRPTTERLTAVLERFAGRRDTIPFRIDGDHFHGIRTVEEPHSFRATLRLDGGGPPTEWTFEQVESRVELGADAIRTGGIVTGESGPSRIEVTVDVPGEVRLNAERAVEVRPRFPGMVREMRKRLGDAVRRGDVLAIVHSNESLSDYSITAAIDGTVVSQDAANGQAVDAQSVLYTVADLSTVWVVFPF